MTFKVKSLSDMKKKFEENRPKEGGSTKNDSFYRFFDMDFSQEAEIRFLPDTNEDNPLFQMLLEKKTHKLVVNGKDRYVSCLNNYGEQCPVCKVSQSYYSAAKKAGEQSPEGVRLQTIGKKYYAKKEYLAHILVVKDPLSDNNAEGKTKFVTLNTDVFKKIVSEIGDLGDVPPCSPIGGVNYKLIKTKKPSTGGKVYADWSTSRFARNPSDLDEDFIDALEDKLIDLSTLLPKNPGLELVEELLRADMEMLDVNEDSDPEEEAKALLRKAKTEKVSTSSKTVKTVVEDSSDEEEDELPPPVKTTTKTKQAVVESSEDEEDDVDEEMQKVMARIKARREVNTD